MLKNKKMSTAKELVKIRNLAMSFHVRTFGCQMNVRDSEVICGLLQKSGYRLSGTDQEADIVIFNTCSVRKHAEERVWSLIGSYKGSKIIGLVGCMAQNYKQQAFERDSHISFVVGPQDIEKIPGIIGQLSADKRQLSAKSLYDRKIWETDGLKRPEEVYHSGFYQDKKQAYVVISEGCSNFCSYCVVPYVRGPLRHRKYKNILAEIEQAIGQGVTKVTLLGQNVNAYRDEQVNFTKLLKQVNALDGLKEFDFFTSHPKDANPDFFKAIRDLEKSVKRLHLPLQSGSDRILKLMRRGYTVKDYLALIDSYRKIVKQGLLTTDIIVGFPTETAEEFQETCALVKSVRFNAAYIFKYSSRPGTEAAKIVDVLKLQEKEKRHKKILDLQRNISRELSGKRT
ncbi:MAG TPA: tRNA (N6-isopentenyl adenosine(37)-C2)-methylthiotransferase MiaB [Candidatus Omnitrophota bacterium]|nr:tRNA (N6-isopentenyl adenosine(37)-C2)-methylthiotransferase MiaB [Candidatus Omnitrophota bacterium]HPT39393.1 tRNA (N6-isopentenyl adenosine(37)-C2)-methylthiotransferase MiaB [Candidatus Omnitrophota bacterium]